MQKITPHLWFDKEAKEAGAFSASVIPNSRVKRTATLHETPSGSVDVVAIELAGQEFRLISAGPLFKFTPAVSFMVLCDTKDEVDSYWRQLSKGGSALMEIGTYPFSERYGWLQDRYGLSWQLMFASGHPIRQKIVPVLMFVGKNAGKAEEAMKFYTSLFPHSKIADVFRYEKGEAPGAEGMIKYGAFALDGENFAAMDSPPVHDFNFNEAVSFIVNCDTQREIDEYWSRMSADPKAEACGWLKDKYGLSWQIVPANMPWLTGDARDDRAMAALMQMKKLDMAALDRAYNA